MTHRAKQICICPPKAVVVLDTTTLKAVLAVFDMQYINFTKEKALELANIIGIDTNL
jgi:hypothetical protein